MATPAEPNYQAESPLTKALAQIASEKWSMYQTDFVPVENRFVNKVNSMNSGGEYNLAGGMANAEATRQFNPVLDQTRGKLIETGAAPGSGAFTMGMNKTRLSGAAATGQAQFTAQQGQQDRYRAGLEALLGIGNGQAVMAQNSVTDLARQSVDQAKQQQAMDWGEKAATVRGIGNIGGMLTNVGLNSVMSK